MKVDPTDKFRHQQDLEYVCKVKDCEFRWNLSIQMATKLKHNKPDWDKAGKIRKIIEISCPAEVDNITKKVDKKLNNYGPLLCQLQIMDLSNSTNCYWSVGLCSKMFRNVYLSSSF